MTTLTVNDLAANIDIDIAIGAIGGCGIPEAYIARAAERHPVGDDGQPDAQCIAIDETGDELWLVGLTTDEPEYEIRDAPDKPAVWRCWDSSGTEVDIVAETAEEAADEYVGDGDWGDSFSTRWATVRCAQIVHGKTSTANTEFVTVSIAPDEPKCGKSAHDWRAPYEIVGGLTDNPGVFGQGGGVRTHTVCVHCGCERVADGWATNPENGEQGLDSVTYYPEKYADEVAGLNADEDDEDDEDDEE